jgi:gliding motility-associated-like protein
MATVNDSCPVITAITTAAICGQTNGTITATGTKGATPYSFSIDGTNFQANNTFTALASGNYTVTIKDVNGNTDSTKVTVADNCLQVSGATIPSTCNNPNGPITATGSDGTSPYQYSIDGVNFQTSDLFSGLAAGNYTLTVKDAIGATGSTTVIVSGTPVPTIAVSENAATCTGIDGSLTITAAGGTAPYTYSEDGSNFGTANVFSGISSGKILSATVEDANGCKVAQQITMTEDCPAIAISVANETCGDDNGSINANGSGGVNPYNYSIDGANFQASNIFNNLNSGSYTVYVKDANGYKNDTTVQLANICPSISAITTNGSCGASAANITATGSGGTPPYLYSIDGINFQTGQNFDNLPDGNYTVTVKDADGLTSSTTVTVKNFPAVTISLVASPASCLNNDGSLAATVSGGTAPFTFSINGGSFQSDATFTSLDSGIKTVMLKDANGCIASQSSVLTLNDNLSLNAGAAATICEGTATTLEATSNGTTFKWSPSTGISDSSMLNPLVSPGSTIQYYIQATLGLCSKIDSVVVTVNPAPIASAGVDTTICFGKSIQLSGSGGSSYSWLPPTYLNNPGIYDPTVKNPQSSIAYSLTVTDNKGCKSLNQSTVMITVTPEAKVFAGDDTAILVNQHLQLNAIDVDGSGFTTFAWSPAQGLSNPSIQDPIASVANNITYFVTASTADGCAGTDSIVITVYDVFGIFVPNAFTPNGDGINDVPKPILIGIMELKYFSVFNRWGQRIFYTTSQGTGWNGTLNGNPSEAGAYVWIAAAIDYNGRLIEKKEQLF